MAEPSEPRQIAPQNIEIAPAPFPARTKQATGFVNGTKTDAMAVYFADKILVTVSQDGRLPHWVHVPLESLDPTLSDRRVQHSDDGAHLLPLPHLTATTILGGGGSDRDILAQLYATQIASAIAARNPEERRLLVLGVGVENSAEQTDREAFLKMLEIVLEVV